MEIFKKQLASDKLAFMVYTRMTEHIRSSSSIKKIELKTYIIYFSSIFFLYLNESTQTSYSPKEKPRTKLQKNPENIACQLSNEKQIIL